MDDETVVETTAVEAAEGREEAELPVSDDPAPKSETSLDPAEGRLPQPEKPPSGSASSAIPGVELKGNLEATDHATQQVATTIYNHYAEREEAAFRVLSRKHFRALEGEALSSRDLVLETEELARLTATVIRHRFLVIVGGKVGKGVMAQAAAARLCEERALTEHEVLWRPALERDLRVSFERLLEPRSSRGGAARRILIVEDALEFENRDVAKYLADLDGRRLVSLRQQLTDQDSYLILTSDPTRITAAGPRLRNLGVLEEVAGPGPELRKRGLYQEAERLVARKGLGGEETYREVRQILEQHGARLAEMLETMPQVVRFVEIGLLDLVRGAVSLEDAVAKAKLEDLTGWFLEELADDPDALSLAIALTLAHAGPQMADAPWFQVYALWRRVALFLRKELGLAEAELEVAQLGIAPAFLEKVRAEVVPAPYPESHAVRFRDSTYPERLWRVVLGSGRAAASLLLPLLRELASSADFYLREAAARALGRIGLLDGGYILFPWMRAAVKAADTGSWIALGQAFHGIMGAGDHGYRDGALRWLRRETAGDAPDFSWARGICIREIGALDLDLALREWLGLLDEKLRDRGALLGDLHRAMKGREVAIRKVASRTGRLRWVDALHDHLLQKIVRENVLTEKEGQVLQALRFSLVGLCFVADPIRVFRHLLPLMDEGERSLSTLLAVLFLDADGVASKLERSEVTLPGAFSHGSTVVCGRILAGMVFEPVEGVLTLRDFLVRLYQSVQLLPRVFSTPFNENLLLLLEHWARVAVKSGVADLLAIVEGLLAGLLGCPDRQLREEVFRLLQQSRAFAAAGSELRPLAIGVLTRPGPGSER